MDKGRHYTRLLLPALLLSVAITRNAAAVEATANNEATSGLVGVEKHSPSDRLGIEHPDLKQINRPVFKPEQVQVNEERVPSFQLRESNGTEIREYRERGKAVEIDVRSGLGTYRVTPKDGSLKPPASNNNDKQRLPTVDVLHF